MLPHRRRHFLWCQRHRNPMINNGVKRPLRMRTILLWAAILDGYACGKSGKHETTSSNIIERDSLGGSGVSGIIMLDKRTDLHIFQWVLSLVPAIVPRFVFLTFIVLEVLWVLSSSSWALLQHLIIQCLSKSCWSVGIFNAWIGPQGPQTYIQPYTYETFTGDAWQRFCSCDWRHKRIDQLLFHRTLIASYSAWIENANPAAYSGANISLNKVWICLARYLSHWRLFLLSICAYSFSLKFLYFYPLIFFF